MTPPSTLVQVQSSQPLPSQNGIAAYHENGSEDGRYVSEEEYWAVYYENSDFHYEWNNGRLEEKPMADYAQFRLYLWFLGLVKDYLYVTKSGRMIGLELAFRMALAHKTAIRKPDLAIVLNSNAIALLDKDRSYKGIFDICIESISDSTKGEVERDTITKLQEYAAAGVKEYYILDEREIETEFYRLNSRGIYVPLMPKDGIIRSQVMPGFQFRLADLYRLPEPPQMIDDPVYQGFVSPFLRTERLRAEEALQIAAKERTRAERYAAMLKSMGVALDDDPAAQ
ncbi:MAG: Uma2 family endonuclease [Caldilineaceae bacterium]